MAHIALHFTCVYSDAAGSIFGTTDVYELGFFIFLLVSLVNNRYFDRNLILLDIMINRIRFCSLLLQLKFLYRYLGLQYFLSIGANFFDHWSIDIPGGHMRPTSFTNRRAQINGGEKHKK